MTALHYVCRKNYNELFNILLEYEPYLDAKDFSGRTPLLYAIINENREIIK